MNPQDNNPQVPRLSWRLQAGPTYPFRPVAAASPVRKGLGNVFGKDSFYSKIREFITNHYLRQGL